MVVHPDRETEIERIAEARGFRLTQREFDNGQLGWTWRSLRSNGSEPRFLTRRQAILYMDEQLSRT